MSRRPTLFRLRAARVLRVVGGVLLCCTALAGPCAAQAVRYELGMRLRALEREWETASTEDKARALPELKSAVDQFFRLRLGAAARGLDRARFELDESADPARLWSAQWSVQPERRFVETRDEPGVLRVTLSPLYDSDSEAPLAARARLRLLAADGRELARGETDLTGDSPSCDLALAGLPAGDHRLLVDFGTPEEVWVRRELRVSSARNAAQRVAAIHAALETGIDAPKLERATATRLLELLDRLLAGETLETDYPATRLLLELERLCAAEADERVYDAALPGESWLRVPIGERTCDARLAAPPVIDGELRPCVVALHGAGGSDNLFFDGYGDGAAVRLALERGWVIIAPRASFFGAVDVAQLIEALAERYAVDRSRIFLLGHSMGAAQAFDAASRAPDSYAAMALVGGGRPGRKDAACASVPTYIAAGSEDFALDGARALHQSLTKHGGSPRFDVRRGIEHLTIVQEVLPAVFAFFDSVNARIEPR